MFHRRVMPAHILLMPSRDALFHRNTGCRLCFIWNKCVDTIGLLHVNKHWNWGVVQSHNLVTKALALHTTAVCEAHVRTLLFHLCLQEDAASIQFTQSARVCVHKLTSILTGRVITPGRGHSHRLCSQLRLAVLFDHWLRNFDSWPHISATDCWFTYTFCPLNRRYMEECIATPPLQNQDVWQQLWL